MHPAGTHCIMLQGVAPLRREPAHAAEMTTELLFGERVTVLQAQEGWRHIRSHEDGYEGWLPATMLAALPDPAWLTFEPHYVQPLVAAVRVSGADNYAADVPVTRAARFYNDPALATDFEYAFAVEGLTYRMPKALVAPPHQADVNALLLHAQEYLHAPYRWGGKTVLGIDCSGLVQTAFALYGILAPRDAWQQATFGTAVSFAERGPGHLAFFANDAGRVTHVGLLLAHNRILHAAGSGRVRIDNMTEAGIALPDGKTLTHHLQGLRAFV
jgi:cell wall-associated NlpC family hydrolase